jgi:2-phosphosulfolactate phosphatase
VTGGDPIEFEWGPQGVELLSRRCDHLVIVDVLSFTTCVDVAVSRGAAVLPWRWYNETAVAFARDRGARLAVRRSEAGPEDLCLAPASLERLAPGEAVVLPSPNGSSLSVAARGHPSVWAGCLRNASALAAHLRRQGGSVGVVAAGERWPDGSLRVAMEDQLGAGAVISRLRGSLGAEAEIARAAFNGARSGLSRLLGVCRSGRELVELGHGQDVAYAAAYDSSRALCRLRGDAYVAV